MFTNFIILWSGAGSQGPQSHILMMGGSNRGSYFIPQKIPTSEFVYPKKSLLFLAYPQKFLSVFASANFIIGKLKHANFNSGFGQKQNYKLRLHYFWFELMKNTIPQKIPLLFSRPKKIPASFIDPKNLFWPKCQTQKNPSDPPVIKICEWGPWGNSINLHFKFGARQTWEPAGRIGELRNFLNGFAKSPRLIVLNIDWVQFILKNCEILHSVQVCMINITVSSQMWCMKSVKGWFTHPQFCWQDFVN